MSSKHFAKWIWVGWPYNECFLVFWQKTITDVPKKSFEPHLSRQECYLGLYNGIRKRHFGKKRGKYDLCHHAQALNVGQKFSDFVCFHAGAANIV